MAIRLSGNGWVNVARRRGQFRRNAGRTVDIARKSRCSANHPGRWRGDGRIRRCQAQRGLCEGEVGTEAHRHVNDDNSPRLRAGPDFVGVSQPLDLAAQGLVDPDLYRTLAAVQRRPFQRRRCEYPDRSG